MDINLTFKLRKFLRFCFNPIFKTNLISNLNLTLDLYLIGIVLVTQNLTAGDREFTTGNFSPKFPL